MAIRALSLCAGIGGLDLGIRLARPDCHVVGFVERQAFAAAVLVAAMERGDLAQAPVWDSITTFDGRPWRGRVDLVTAGYPCQPESLAGKRGGVDDERWLWRDVWRIVRDVGARYLFVENVAGHLSGTFSRVLGDLAASGWAAEWDCVPAAAVGAPHLRDRVFLLGRAPSDAECSALRLEPKRDQRDRGREREAEREQAEPVDDGGARDATDTDGARPQGSDGAGEVGRPRRRGAAATAIADFERLAGPYRATWTGRPTPEPCIRRVDDGTPGGVDDDRDWAERLYALGNAVVPQAAAAAFDVLWGRLHSDAG